MEKVAILDLMGVLYTEPHAVKNRLHPWLESLGYGKNYEFVKGIFIPYSKAKITNEEFWKKILKEDYNNKVFNGSHKNFEKEFLNSFEADPYYKTVIKHLLQKGYRLGIVSDLPREWAEYLIGKLELSEVFNPIVLGGQVKANKPDPRIYEEIQRRLERANIQFDEIAIVDDRKIVNESFAHHFSRLGKKVMTVLSKKEDVDITSTFQSNHVIQCLQDLMKIL